MNNKEFYNEAFKGYTVPEKLKNCSIEICNTFNIKGICDPMYICNNIAFTLEIGDGHSNFNNDSINCEKITKTINTISNCYMNIDKDKLEKIILNKLL